MDYDVTGPPTLSTLGRVKSFVFRYRARTILIVCPASLQSKWQAEMLEKFGLEFRIVDTAYLKELRRRRGIHANPWTSFPRLVTSMDWVKNEIPMRYMRDVIPLMPSYPRKFDLLIADEAHNVAPSGSGNYAGHFEHRLFLSATPHNGYQESFTSLLELVDDHLDHPSVRLPKGFIGELDRLLDFFQSSIAAEESVDLHRPTTWPALRSLSARPLTASTNGGPAYSVVRDAIEDNAGRIENR